MGPCAVERRKGLGGWCNCVGLSPLEPALLPQEDPADGHRRAGALQIGHEGPADLRIGGQLAKVYPTHSPGRDVPDQERPPGEPVVRQECEQLIGGAGRRVFGDRGGAVRSMIAVCRVIRLAKRHPAIPFGGRKSEIVLGARVQAARA